MRPRQRLEVNAGISEEPEIIIMPSASNYESSAPGGPASALSTPTGTEPVIPAIMADSSTSQLVSFGKVSFTAYDLILIRILC